MDTVLTVLDQGVAVAVDLIQAVTPELILFEHSDFDEINKGAAVAGNLILKLKALSLPLSLLMRTDWLQVLYDQTADQATLGSAAEEAH
jgi:hypothetical protein